MQASATYTHADGQRIEWVCPMAWPGFGRNLAAVFGSIASRVRSKRPPAVVDARVTAPSGVVVWRAFMTLREFSDHADQT